MYQNHDIPISRIELLLQLFSICRKKDTTDTRHTLKEVEITAWQQRKILSGLLSGKIKLNVAELNTLPRFLGETDVLRTMKLMPGVLTTGELNSGFYVRGSESSHNQILERSSHIQCYAHAGFFLGIQ